jgi:phosphatidylserine decarboxylase
MQSLKEERIPYRVAEWLPSDHARLSRWLDGMIQKTEARSRALHPVIAEFQNLIESDPEVFMLFNQMFEQVPRNSVVCPRFGVAFELSWLGFGFL